MFWGCLCMFILYVDSRCSGFQVNHIFSSFLLYRVVYSHRAVASSMIWKRRRSGRLHRGPCSVNILSLLPCHSIWYSKGGGRFGANSMRRSSGRYSTANIAAALMLARFVEARPQSALFHGFVGLKMSMESFLTIRRRETLPFCFQRSKDPSN